MLKAISLSGAPFALTMHQKAVKKAVPEAVSGRLAPGIVADGKESRLYFKKWGNMYTVARIRCSPPAWRVF
jgi:hypothetical protein